MKGLVFGFPRTGKRGLGSKDLGKRVRRLAIRVEVSICK